MATQLDHCYEEYSLLWTVSYEFSQSIPVFQSKSSHNVQILSLFHLTHALISLSESVRDGDPDSVVRIFIRLSCVASFPGPHPAFRCLLLWIFVCMWESLATRQFPVCSDIICIPGVYWMKLGSSAHHKPWPNKVKWDFHEYTVSWLTDCSPQSDSSQVAAHFVACLLPVCAENVCKSALASVVDTWAAEFQLGNSRKPLFPPSYKLGKYGYVQLY